MHACSAFIVYLNLCQILKFCGDKTNKLQWFAHRWLFSHGWFELAVEVLKFIFIV